MQLLYDLFLSSTGVTTDSRAIKGGELFFALRGENFDGNAYAIQALSDGASYAIVNEDSLAARSGDSRVIAVPDPLQTLKDLAAWHRNHTFVDGKRLTVIGLTGTNGKTTTKELIRAVLSCKYRVTATEGNLNNDIGVPLSVLKINASTQIAVIEMGANHPEDIAALTPVSQPDFGLITNVGKAHLLGFGSFEGVKHAKGRLYDYIAANGGSVFVNTDDPDLMQMASDRGLSILPYGLTSNGAAIIPATQEQPFLRMTLGNGEYTISTRLAGSYNANNVLAAIAVGVHFGIPLDDAIAAIEAYSPANNRSQLTKTLYNTVIADMYNANPTSMSAALDNIAMMTGSPRAALLGQMGELGAESVAEHVNVLRKVLDSGFEHVYLVGDEFRKALDCVGSAGATVQWFPSSDELSLYIKANPLKGFTILLKGSRSVKMENVLPVL
ncbi:MAG: UDP-N-acetylmuramoyl-tripeptide--D-alanyl-D-alanine ligase [Bacteroidales bacterium]|nr:UDP-N-acetylmuramoyl-tripeptide--D-alanyl-D-alanine ligase [Bacteroidales bacterium]